MKNFESRLQLLESHLKPKERIFVLIIYSNEDSSDTEVHVEGKVYKFKGSKDTQEIEEFLKNQKFKGKVSTVVCYLPQKKKLDEINEYQLKEMDE